MPRNDVAGNLLKQAFIWQLEQLKNIKILTVLEHKCQSYEP